MSSSPPSITSDDIYFGTVPVLLKSVAGTVVPFVESEWRDDATSAPTAFSRNGYQNPPENIVIPGIPALDIVCVREGGPSSDVSKLPSALRAPLIKVPLGSAEGVLGVASGVRSCLVKLEGSWWRLKGSGNNDSGFLVKEDTDEKGVKWKQVRGSAFPHTAIRELAVTARLEGALKPEGILGANSAGGMMLYSSPSELPLGSSFPTACIVERTLGDRRFGSHVLGGLAFILPLIIDESRMDVEAFLKAFPAARPPTKTERIQGVDVTPLCLATANIIGDHQLKAQYDMSLDAETAAAFASALEYAALPLTNEILCDATQPSLALPLRVPDATTPPLQYTVAGSKEMSPAWKAAWGNMCRELGEALKTVTAAGPGVSKVSSASAASNSATASNSASVSASAEASDGIVSNAVGYLFHRIGYDAGRIMAGMHKAKLSWGTYADAMCLPGAYHCNAHANNVVVVAEDSVSSGTPGAESLLAFLDLDMAFGAESYVDMLTGAHGLDAEKFEALLKFENANFMEVLVGNDTTTGVARVAQTAVAKVTTPVLGAVKAALFDTLILGYEQGRSHVASAVAPSASVFDAKMHKASHCIIRLAIAIMADLIA